MFGLGSFLLLRIGVPRSSTARGRFFLRSGLADAAEARLYMVLACLLELGRRMDLRLELDLRLTLLLELEREEEEPDEEEPDEEPDEELGVFAFVRFLLTAAVALGFFSVFAAALGFFSVGFFSALAAVFARCARFQLDPIRPTAFGGIGPPIIPCHVL